MKELDDLIKELESNIPHYELIAPEVSKSSVGWHIDHTLITVILITEALKKSDPDKYKWKFNLTRTLVMTMSKIPRGRGKAPGITLPDNEINPETLKVKAEAASLKINELNELQSNHYFEHPYFGDLNLKPAKKMLLIHTRHHLDIIKDIIRIKK